jgi:hypothetical protein
MAALALFARAAFHAICARGCALDFKRPCSTGSPLKSHCFWTHSRADVPPADAQCESRACTMHGAVLAPCSVSSVHATWTGAYCVGGGAGKKAKGYGHRVHGPKCGAACFTLRGGRAEEKYAMSAVCLVQLIVMCYSLDALAQQKTHIHTYTCSYTYAPCVHLLFLSNTINAEL